MHAHGKLVINLTRGSVVCDDVIIADRARRRMRGLLGRASLASGEGMLLQPAPSIHTAFMRFAIDAVFMDGTLCVNKIVQDLPPWRMASAHHAWAVLELAAGEVERRGIEVGDRLGVVEVGDELGSFVFGRRWEEQEAGGESAPILAEPADTAAGQARDGDFGGAASQNGRATKVLLVGTDRRFRSVASALLTRRGCAVTLGEDVTNAAELASHDAPDVVILDAGISVRDAAEAAAQLETLERPVGVVVVGEEVDEGLSALPLLPKWGSFNDLYRAVEEARPEGGSSGAGAKAERGGEHV